MFALPKILSQDTHFSQYSANPLALNPALTGNFEGDWRVAGNFRNQWRSIAIPYNTYSLSYDRRYYPLNQQIGAGIYLLNDNSGDAALNVLKVYASGSYYKNLNNNDIHVGLQLGFVNKSYNYASLTFPDQFDMSEGHFNNGMTTGEAGMGERLAYLDINLGTTWRKKIGRFEPFVGMALFHLNSPKESYYNFNYRLPIRTVLHGKVKTEVTEKIFIAPALLYMRERTAENFMIGLDAGIRLKGNITNVSEAFGGIHLRDGFAFKSDAIVLVAGANVRRLDIGISYDFNISPLGAVTNNRGAFEISFIYKSISTILNSYSIPCERF